MPKIKPTKTALVLSLPATTPAAEVVALANKRGIKISKAYVHVIRSNARKPRNGVKRGRTANGSSEAALRTAIAELGLTRARQVLADVERAFR
jgi:hypothetical protein